MADTEHLQKDGASKFEDENRYLDGFLPGWKVLRPSVAYSEACASYSSRISELIFGSLLASYILGFMNFGAQVKAPFSFIELMIISLTFSCLTAGFYMTYHNSILTMPNVPISDLTTDFLIALLQAVTFGISMIKPSYFAGCLGMLLALVFWRQQAKSRRLGQFFYERLVPASLRDRGATAKAFHTELAILSKRDKHLEGWGPVNPSYWLGVVVLIIVGLAIGFANTEKVKNFAVWGSSIPILGSLDTKVTSHTINVIVGVWISVATIRILKGKSLVKDESGQPVVLKMDAAAQDLVNAWNHKLTPESKTTK